MGDNSTAKLPQCAYCAHQKCDITPEMDVSGLACMLAPLEGKDRDEVVNFYRYGVPQRVMEASDAVASECHDNGYSHVYAIIEFCKRMGFSHIGIATCTMFHNEARVLARRLKDAGFRVSSAACKTGEVHRSEVGLDASTFDGCVCNPFRQAQLLNAAQTDLNISVGLCIGHDMLFNKLSNALVTTLFTKDYAHGHKAILDLQE